MKKLIYIALAGILFPLGASAQTGFSWTRKPAAVQPAASTNVVVTEYYYYPNQEVYYSIASKRWIYNDNGKWVNAYVLPARYNVVSLKNSSKVKFNYKGNRPYIHNANHKAKYPPGQIKKAQGVQSAKPYTPAVNKPNSNGNSNHSQGKGKGKK